MSKVSTKTTAAATPAAPAPSVPTGTTIASSNAASAAIPTLNRAALLQNVKALGKVIDNSGVPTHKYLTFHPQRNEFLVKSQDGSEKTVAAGTEMALNFAYMQHGYVCWKDGKPHDQVSWNMLQTPTLPPIDSLPDHGPYTVNDNQRDGWKYQITLPLKDVKTNDEYLFKTGADSSVRQVQGFIDTLHKAVVLHDPVNEVPIVILGKGSFTPRGRTNKVFIPKFALRDAWMKITEIEMRELRVPNGTFMLQEIEQRNSSPAVIDNTTTIDAE
jgi:hypothetical protein